MSAEKSSNNSAIGYVLIFIGAFMLLAKLGVVSDLIFLYLVGGGFILTYFLLGGNRHYGNIGFLIPGTIVIAVGLFADLDKLSFFHAFGGGLFFVFLAAAFMIVWLHTRQFTNEDWGSRNWPLFPAGGLITFALFVFLAEHDKYILGKIKVMSIIVPLVLITIGIYFIVNSKKQDVSDKEQQKNR